MDLYSGIPCWALKNQLFDYFNPLQADFTSEVAIIGSGITGALVANELRNAGIECCLVDKRTLCTGSSLASTALLQYEIDVPLCKMSLLIGEQNAVQAFRACLQAIDDLEAVFASSGFDPDFERVPSVYYASNQKDLAMIKEEFLLRKKHKLPVTFLDRPALFAAYGIKARGALMNRVSAQVDTHGAAAGLLAHHLKKGLTIFSHTNIVACRESKRGYLLEAENGHSIRCKYVVIAAGFEAGQFLPKQVMQLSSTYALMSQPVAPEHLWPERSLIWETKDPYLYIRTTNQNRILVGGEDEEFKDPVRRDKLLRKKASILERKFTKLFPRIPFVPEVAWCGTFSSTKDGLPYIGEWPGKKRMFFALGYGGNGITFSMIAGQVIKNMLQGAPDERAALFAFDRKTES